MHIESWKLHLLLFVLQWWWAILLAVFVGLGWLLRTIVRRSTRRVIAIAGPATQAKGDQS